MREDVTRVTRVSVVGTGLVGSRWAAFYLARGLDVVAYDNAPDFEERLRRDVSEVWWALERMGLADGASVSRLSCASNLPDAIAETQFVQESASDDEDLKQRLLAEIEAASSPSTIIASSTSGIPPSILQSMCTRPDRVLVAHPINPVHILPLVEVVAGRETSQETLDWTMAFYRRLGKRPLHVRKEVPGFIVNRLLQSLYREMVHLVNDGIATTAEVDAAVVDGPGPRLALLGPAAVLCLVGGQGGMARTFAQFEPSRMDDWSHNHYPNMTEGLLRLLDEQTREQLTGRSINEWEHLRDDFLLRVLELRKEAVGETALGQ